jgi:F-type H+-transporting ATPase subunit gamma
VGNLKEIRRRIGSVKNTKQITRAMKLVSAAKLRRAQEAAMGGRAFSERLGGVLAQVTADVRESFSHPLLEKRDEVKHRTAVVIAGERGLCGAFNTNVFKAVIAKEAPGAAGSGVDIVAVGKRSVAAAKSKNWKLKASFEGLAEDAASWPISEMVDSLVADFISGRSDEVVLYYTKFVSTMTQTVEREVLLPFESGPRLNAAPDGEESELSSAKYDPAPEEILARLIPLVIKTKVTQAALESKASEHASRMSAMDSATRNADELIDKLRLYYNRARQSAITTELIDIVGGAEAQQ